ncbi:MAG: undecaprenyl-diphosphate phosphatase [Bacteroidales bacterium]|jgi:undecaprenyl-diphosphatase|nr:undecaprenyl-diphosphate phosphatase [Bacteroidales bacterium]
MHWIEALILGLVQGLTEFLPVSSSGHLELGKYLLGVNPENSLVFTVVVHGATVLSTIVVFRKDIWEILKGMLVLSWNSSWKFVVSIVISMIPVLVVGLYFKDYVESFFSGNIRFVGMMLIVTAALLALTHFKKSHDRKINFLDAFTIGIAQTIAVLPGISRSGATISTGLLLGNKRELVARFSFLMVLIPIIGANVLDLFKGEMNSETGVGALALIVGFVAAFVAGLLACKWMINIVKKGKLIYFAAYCLVIGLLAIFVA